MVAKRHQRGVGLIDLIITLFLLATAGAIFSAAFPTAISASRQAKEYKLATAIAQRKMEQLRSMGYASLTQPLLAINSVIDSNSSESPNTFTFTSVDNIASQITSGTGILEITKVPSGVKKVRITITWMNNSNRQCSIQLTSLIADKRARAVS
ncbi:hypothetical protein LLG46_09875 [bacterium]|nr:hypothetical protein [bacterium]